MKVTEPKPAAPPKIVPQKPLKSGTIEPERDSKNCEKETKRNWAWVWTYLVILICVGTAYYLVLLNVIRINDNVDQWVEKGFRAAIFDIIILMISRLIDAIAISQLAHDYTRYNLRRVLSLLTFILLAATTISIIFVNWYAAAVSLGIISLILGFALQTPITSFIGWIYILVKRPYNIGDRIELNGVTGDVIDIGYIDTTLWEFGGKYLSTDHPSGRLIKFPNSLLLNTTVINYTWSYFPFIWDEIRFYVAFQSDLNFVTSTMQKIVEDYLGDEMKEQVKTFRALLSESPIDDLSINEKPTVFYRIDANTWVQATVRYIVDPHEAGPVKSHLITEILTALNAEPTKVMFPKGDNR